MERDYVRMDEIPRRRTQNRSRTMGLGCIVAGAFFLFDPFLAVMDFLPDVLGYLLIMRGLSRLQYLDSHLESAHAQFKKLALLALVRLLTLPFIFGLTAPSEHGMELLLCTFCLAVLDAIVLIPAWQQLAKGLISLTYLHGGRVPLEAPVRRGAQEAAGTAEGRQRASRTDRLLYFTLFFMIFKEVMAVLPELSILSNVMSGADAGLRWGHVYEYIGLMRILSGLLVLVVGSVWLIRLIRYAVRLRADDDFFGGAGDAYEQTVLSRPGIFIKHDIYFALFIMGIGMIFSMDFYVDGINLLPDVVAAVCFLVSLCMLRPYAFHTKPAIIGSILLIPINAVTSLWQAALLHQLAMSGGEDFSFLENASRMARDPESFRMFFYMCTAFLVSKLILIALIYGIYRSIRSVIRRYTGLLVTDASHERVDTLHRDMCRQLLIVMAIGMVANAFSVVYMMTLPYAWNTVMEMFGLLDITLHIVYASLFFWQIHKIREQIEYRFLLS